MTVVRAFGASILPLGLRYTLCCCYCLANKFMTETAYLKEELGPVLAKGLAAVAIARPSNPTEYLALWLLHYLQQRQRKVDEVEKSKALEAEREEWAKGRAMREKMASVVLQREWRAHLTAKKEAAMKEADLREAFSKIEESLDERVPEEAPAAEGADKSEQEREAELARSAQQTAFRRAKVFVEHIDKSAAAQIRMIPATNADAYRVLRCCFYAAGMRPKQVNTTDKIRSLFKPFQFTQFLSAFNPLGTPLPKKRMIVRVRRLLSTVKAEQIKKASAALHAIFQWLNAAVLFRCARDEHIKLRKAAGKEVDEEIDEEEEVEGEEPDAEEEVVRQKEIEEKKELEARLAAEAAPEKDATNEEN